MTFITGKCGRQAPAARVAACRIFGISDEHPASRERPSNTAPHNSGLRGQNSLGKEIARRERVLFSVVSVSGAWREV